MLEHIGVDVGQDDQLTRPLRANQVPALLPARPLLPA